MSCPKRSAPPLGEPSVPEGIARSDHAVDYLQAVFRDLVERYPGHADILDPLFGEWDQGSAEVLTRVCESAGFDNLRPDSPAAAAPALALATQPFKADDGEHGRSEDCGLDARLASLSRTVERVLVDESSEPSLLALSLRFNDLERRVALATGTAPDDPAPRIAVKGALAPCEAGGPDRLDVIENMLAHVVNSLSDARFAHVVARTSELAPPAREPEPVLHAPEIDDIAERVEELFGFVARAIDEQRRANESLTTMLASIQQMLARAPEPAGGRDQTAVPAASRPESPASGAAPASTSSGRHNEDRAGANPGQAAVVRDPELMSRSVAPAPNSSRRAPNRRGRRRSPWLKLLRLMRSVGAWTRASLLGRRAGTSAKL